MHRDVAGHVGADAVFAGAGIKRLGLFVFDRPGQSALLPAQREVVQRLLLGFVFACDVGEVIGTGERDIGLHHGARNREPCRIAVARSGFGLGAGLRHGGGLLAPEVDVPG